MVGSLLGGISSHLCIAQQEMLGARASQSALKNAMAQSFHNQAFHSQAALSQMSGLHRQQMHSAQYSALDAAWRYDYQNANIPSAADERRRKGDEAWQRKYGYVPGVEYIDCTDEELAAYLAGEDQHPLHANP